MRSHPIFEAELEWKSYLLPFAVGAFLGGLCSFVLSLPFFPILLFLKFCSSKSNPLFCQTIEVLQLALVAGPMTGLICGKMHRRIGGWKGLKTGASFIPLVILLCAPLVSLLFRKDETEAVGGTLKISAALVSVISATLVCTYFYFANKRKSIEADCPDPMTPELATQLNKRGFAVAESKKIINPLWSETSGILMAILKCGFISLSWSALVGGIGMMLFFGAIYAWEPSSIFRNEPILGTIIGALAGGALGVFGFGLMGLVLGILLGAFSSLLPKHKNKKIALPFIGATMGLGLLVLFDCFLTGPSAWKLTAVILPLFGAFIGWLCSKKL